MALANERCPTFQAKKAPRATSAADYSSGHPKLGRPVIIVVLSEQIEGLKADGDIVTLQVRTSDRQSREMQVRLANFNKLSATSWKF
jgi:hypothetical protein